MALKLLSMCRGAAQCLQQMNRQAGVIVHHCRPSPLGFKVRLLVSTSGSGVPKDFRPWTVQRLQMSDHHHHNSNVFQRKPSFKGLSNMSRNISQTQPKSSNSLREFEMNGGKASSYAQSWRRKEELKARHGNDALKSIADSAKPLKTLGAKNGVRYSFAVDQPSRRTDISQNEKSADEIPLSFHLPNKKKPQINVQSKGNSEIKSSTFKKKQANQPAKTDRSHAQKRNKLGSENSQSVKRLSELNTNPKVMDSDALSRTSLHALNLETVSKSMAHLSGKRCPTDLQNRDISDEEKTLPETWIPQKWIRKEESPRSKKTKFVKSYQNQDVFTDNLERKWEGNEEESFVNGWGQSQETNWSQATYIKNLPDSQSKTTSHAHFPVKSSFGNQVKAGLGLKGSSDIDSKLNPTSKKSLPQPLLCVTPDEIVKSKSLSSPGKVSTDKKSIDNAPKKFSQSAAKPKKTTKSNNFQLKQEKKEWLKDIRQYIQAQNGVKSKTKNGRLTRETWESPKKSKSTLELNKQRSPRSSIEVKSMDKPITEIASRDILTAVTAKSTNKAAGERIPEMKFKNSSNSVNKSPQQAKLQQPQQKQNRQPPWKPHVALEESVTRLRDQKRSVDTTPSSTFLARHNATPGVIKMAPSIQPKVYKTETRKTSASQNKSMDDVITLESADRARIHSSHANAFILSYSDLTEKIDENIVSTTDLQKEKKSKKDSIVKRSGRDQPQSKILSSEKPTLASVKNTAPGPNQPVSEHAFWPFKEEIGFPLGDQPFNPSGLEKRSDFHRDVYKTYQGNKSTCQDLNRPSQVSNPCLNEKGKVKDCDDISGLSMSPSGADENFQSDKDRGHNLPEQKSKAFDEVKDKSTIEYHPYINKSMFDSLDGFMTMEAKEVKDPSPKSFLLGKPVPLNRQDISKGDVSGVLNSSMGKPAWSLTKEKKDTADKNSYSIFLEEELQQMDLAKHHDRPKREKLGRKNKKEYGKRDKVTKKPKREKKNTKKSSSDNGAIYI